MNCWQLDIQRLSQVAGIPSDESFQQWFEKVMTGKKNAAEMTIRIVDEAESQQLNRDYRAKDKPTNVLSFGCQVAPEMAGDLLGDLVICASVVSREAAEQEKSLDAHWAHMTVHGCLHLLGYDHQQDAQAREMEAEERNILTGLGFPDPYELNSAHIRHRPGRVQVLT